jgi:hypothetical protein
MTNNLGAERPRKPRDIPPDRSTPDDAQMAIAHFPSPVAGPATSLDACIRGRYLAKCC